MSPKPRHHWAAEVCDQKHGFGHRKNLTGLVVDPILSTDTAKLTYKNKDLYYGT